MLKHVHIGIRISDIEKSAKFYTELMGCTVVSSVVTPNAKCTFISAGGTLIELVSREGDVPAASEQVHIAFYTDDIYASIEKIRAYGVEFKEDSYPFSLDKPKQIGDNSYIFFFRGPDGELIEICQNAGTGK